MADVPENTCDGDRPQEFSRRFKDILQAETTYLHERRKAKFRRRHKVQEPPPGAPELARELTGLAISGGGVRSASFAIGVMQGLHEKGILDRFDYMSTVSGGGYAGGALTWFLSYNRASNDDHAQRYWLQGRNFPFSPNRELPTEPENPGLKYGRENIDFIRQRSAYLEPGAGLTKLSAASVMLRGTFISLVAYIFIFALVYSAFELVSHWIWQGIIVRLPLAVGAFLKEIGLSTFLLVAATMLALTLLLWLLYSILSAIILERRAAYSLRRFFERIGGWVFGAIFLVAALGLLDQFFGYSKQEHFLKDMWAAAGGSSVLGVTAGFFSRYLLNAEGGRLTRLTQAVLPVLASILLIMGMGFFGVWLGNLLFQLETGLLTLVLVFGFSFCLVANINNSGLHRMYRDRLMETFMPNHGSVRSDAQAAKSSADSAKLHEMCSPDVDGPLHIINTNVILLGGKKARYRSRFGDSFMLSPLYSGSEATGWIRSDCWLADRPGI
ncbi:MAG: patatin-like phospholipase family protein, partial [Parasphingopyxis sp.]